jgi:hypothetical protein
MSSKLVFGAAFLLGGTFLTSAASAQCPTVGNDTGCGIVITVTGTGATFMPTGMGPYDGSDDTLVGVVNNIPACTPGQKSQTACGVSIYSLDLSATNTIFGFDGDGISRPTYGIPNNAMDVQNGNTQYGGPNAYFTNINAAKTAGRVNFITPIAPGKTDFFSLENALNMPTACTDILKNSLKGASGTGSTPPPVGNMPNSVPPVSAASMQNTGMRATFVPQGNDPTTGMLYTLAAAAKVCGFLTTAAAGGSAPFPGFNWQQTVTNDPNGIPTNCPPTPLKAPPPYNDPPACGYAGEPAPVSKLPTYYDSDPTATFYPLPNFQTTNSLSFQDFPKDSSLTGAQALNFTTQLVGLQGPDIQHAAVVPTGILFTWTSNYNPGTGTGGARTNRSTIPNSATTSGTGGATVTSVSETPTYNGVAVAAVNGSTNNFGPTTLLSAVLPESRSAQVNGTVTAFATIINTGMSIATSCSIAPASTIPTTFAYQTTNPATNAVTGAVNTPVDVQGNNGSQSFVIAFTPTAAIAPTDVAFNFSCTNTSPAPIVTGLNTLLLSASTTPTPDVIALGATLQNDGIVHATGAGNSGVFAVATDNLGSSDTITVATNTGSATLPLSIMLCQTNTTTGACMQTPSATVTTTIAKNATPTFGIFVSASGAIPFDPAGSRIFVTFTDSTRAVRGETSVAVETQ